MKTLLTLCLAVAGLAGFTSVNANAATTTVATSEVVATLPAVVHIDQTVVVETGHRHYYHRRHYVHRRYYYRHHRRYYY